MWIGELGALVRDQPKAVNVHMYSKRMTKSKRVSSVRELKERKESIQVENANPWTWTCFSSVGGEHSKNVRPPSSPLWNPFQPHHSLFFLLVCVFILPIDSRLLRIGDPLLHFALHILYSPLQSTKYVTYPRTGLRTRISTCRSTMTPTRRCV